MKASSPPLLDLTASQQEAVVRKWLAQVCRTYPEETSRFLVDNKDPFRNPVGRVLKHGLPVVVRELFGAFDETAVRSALDEIVHVRAVQDFAPGQAVDFIFLLRTIVREECALDGPRVLELQTRIDRLALLAFDLYMHCREKSWEIRVNEAKRRVYVLEKIASRRANGSSPASA